MNNNQLLKIAILCFLVYISLFDKCIAVPEGSIYPPLTFSLANGKKAKIKKFHPSIKLLDNQGNSVLKNNTALSLMKSCGTCHNTDYIERNNYHAQVGLNESVTSIIIQSQQVWNSSSGLFGRWNPLTYRVLSSYNDTLFDMGTAEWIIAMSPRHVGGGPAMKSRYSDQVLSETLNNKPFDPETHYLDPEIGLIRKWNFQASGGLELNCLMCHMSEPNNKSRIQTIQNGQFKWASTATLIGSGIVDNNGETFIWCASEFQPHGYVSAEVISLSHPKNNNCQQCHGRECQCMEPVIFKNSLENWSVETTGELFSSGKLIDSGMNLKNKSTLFLPWDIHAQRLLSCTTCHYSLNNPTYQEKEYNQSKPTHLQFDARKMNINEYLYTPDHNLAKGHTAQGTVAPQFSGTMRNCRDCHNAESSHSFLPYASLHFEKIACQTCHIPKIYAPVRQVTDWTVITKNGQPRLEYRGIHGQINDSSSLISGYTPLLFLHEEDKKLLRVAPYNLIISWFWVNDFSNQPVRLYDLKAAYFTRNGLYHDDIIKTMDVDKNSHLSEEELILNTPEKISVVKNRLQSVGVKNPIIM